MIRRRRLEDGRVEVTLELSSDICVGTIFLAGDFNGWDPSSTSLSDAGTVRRLVIVLTTGRYAFRYFADGSWFNDPEADDYEPNEFGGLNGVLDLPADDDHPIRG